MSQDATTKAISAQTGYYTCGTAAGTPDKVVTVESGNLYKLTSGGHFKVKMTNKNTAASGVTLQIGSEMAAALWYNGAAVSATNTWDAGEVISVYYDGQYYQASNAQGGGGKAEKIKYDNSQSGLAAENVQEALDEIAGKEILNTAYGSEEDGFYLVDRARNVGLRYNNDGLDAGKVNRHFASVLKNAGVDVGNIADVAETGLFVCDGSLNIGFLVDDEGVHAPNMVAFEIIEY